MAFGCGRSDSFQLRQSPFVGDVPGVQGRLGLKEQNLRLFVGYRKMLHAARDDDEFAWTYDFLVIAEFHAHAAFNHQEHFVLVVVMMPDELPLKTHGLDVAVVDFAQDLGAPVLFKLRKFLGDVDGLHGSSRAPAKTSECARPRPPESSACFRRARFPHTPAGDSPCPKPAPSPSLRRRGRASPRPWFPVAPPATPVACRCR